MKTLLQLSPVDLRRAADIKDELVKLQGQLGAVLTNGKPVQAAKKKHWTQTPAGRARISKAIKRHWRRVHANK